MGWWSTEINGGDIPMDIEGCLAEFMGLDYEADDYDGVAESGRLTTKVVRSFLSYKHLNDERGFADSMIDGGQGSILYTVLGAMLMEAGAEIPVDFRAEIIKNACLDRWADDNEERQVVIEEFIETLENYVDGVPTELARGSFFDRMAKTDYTGAEPCAATPMLPLADLMPRIGAVLISFVGSKQPPVMYNVVGYERGLLLCRSGHEDRILTLDNLRSLQKHEEYELRLFELNELTIVD